MQVNMLEAKSQLSKLVKAAQAGEDVVIASNGVAQVRLVPCSPATGLRGWGAWSEQAVNMDEAFSADTDHEIARCFEAE